MRTILGLGAECIANVTSEKSQDCMPFNKIRPLASLHLTRRVRRQEVGSYCQIALLYQGDEGVVNRLERERWHCRERRGAEYEEPVWRLFDAGLPGR